MVNVTQIQKVLAEFPLSAEPSYCRTEFMNLHKLLQLFSDWGKRIKQYFSFMAIQQPLCAMHYVWASMYIQLKYMDNNRKNRVVDICLYIFFLCTYTLLYTNCVCCSVAHLRICTDLGKEKGILYVIQIIIVVEIGQCRKSYE